MLELRAARGTHRRDVAHGPGLTHAGAARKIERLGGPIVAAAIPTIETLGGGSVRCMLAEIHLPKKK